VRLTVDGYHRADEHGLLAPLEGSSARYGSSLCENALIASGARLIVATRHSGHSMKRFIEGDERSQVTLLPECLDDYIAEDNPVRVVDVFVDQLRLHDLGFGLRFDPK